MKSFKTFILMVTDIFLINMGYLLAINIIYGNQYTEIASIYQKDCLVITAIYVMFFYVFKMYHSLWVLTGTDEFLLGVGGCVSAGLLSIAYTRVIGATVPLNVSVIGVIITMCFVLGIRILYRVYRRVLLYIPYKYSSDQKRVLIVGAGSAGSMIINEMLSRRELKHNPVALIDDDKYKKGKRISGVKVVGNRNNIPRIVEEKEIDLILIAIPTLDNKNKKEIIDICKTTGCKMKIIPGMYEIITGKARVSNLKDVEL